MTTLSSGAESTVGPERVCRKCGHLVSGDICQECADNPFDRTELHKRAGSIRRIIRLIMVAMMVFGAETLIVFFPYQLVQQLFTNATGIVGYVILIVGMVVISIVPGACTGSAAIRVAGNQWRLSRRNRILLWASALIFILLPTLDLIRLLAFFANTYHPPPGILEMTAVFYSFAFWSGVVILMRSLGTCSHQDPGGEARWFLRKAWIGGLVLTVLYVITMLVWFYFGMRMDGNPLGNLPRLMASLRLIGITIQLIYFVYILIYVGLMFSWQRTMIQCAGSRQAP